MPKDQLQAIREALNPLVTRWAEEDVLERYTAVITLRANNVPDDQIDPAELNLFRDAGVRNAIITDHAHEQLTALLQECEDIARDHFLSIPPRTPRLNIGVLANFFSWHKKFKFLHSPLAIGDKLLYYCRLCWRSSVGRAADL